MAHTPQLPFLKGSSSASLFGLSNKFVVESAPIHFVKLPSRRVRKVSERATALCAANLNRFGQPGPILVSDDLVVIHGEEILAAASRLGWRSINIVRMPNLNESERRVLTLALAKLPLLSSWDDEALRVELSELVTLDLDFQIEDMTGFSIAEIDLILTPGQDEAKDDPLDTLPDDLPGEPVSRPGDLWVLGDNRLLCGDALDPESYRRVMEGTMARMVFTDPPYNIPIAGHVSGLGKVKHRDFAAGVGEMSFEAFSAFLKQALTNATSHLIDGGLLYMFMDRRHIEELLRAARETGLSIVDMCIWNKLVGGMGSFYRSQHEPILVFRSGNASHLNNIELGRHGRYRSNVWDHRGLASFGRDRRALLTMHPTVKPVSLIVEAIKDGTRRNDIVVDPFAGSGSTIIAAERARRIGYGIELEPRYVDIIVRRWEAMSGHTAVYQTSGATFGEMLATKGANTKTR